MSATEHAGLKLLAGTLAAESAAIQKQLDKYHQTVLRLVETEFAALAQGAPGHGASPLGEEANMAGKPEFDPTLFPEPVDVVDGQDGTRRANEADIEMLNTQTMQTTLSKLTTHIQEKGRLGVLKSILHNPAFEAFFIGIVIANTMISALQAQYDGIQIGYDLGFAGYAHNAADTWPSAASVFRGIEIGCAVMYTIETTVKILAFGRQFWKDPWNVFDFFAITLWYLTETTGLSVGGKPTILRLCRLARLIRLVRHVGYFEAFDSLHMLIIAIRSSLSVLVWSSLLLFTLLVMFALVMNGLLSAYMETDLNTEVLDPELRKKKHDVFILFGTFSRSFISIFEIAFASHAQICRTIMNNCGEWYAVLFVVFKCVVGLSIMKVITGVFLHETFKVCSQDDELMVMQRRHLKERHVKKMHAWFNKHDTNGNGSLSQEEFTEILADEWVQTWLAAMDLDPTDTNRLWRLLHDGDDNLTVDKWTKGVARLKGFAKSADMNHLAFEIAMLKDEIVAVHSKVGATQGYVRSQSLALSALTMDGGANTAVSRVPERENVETRNPGSNGRIVI